MHFRQRVENRAISLEAIEADQARPETDEGVPEADETDQPTARDLDDEELIDQLEDRLFDVALPGRHQSTVRNALKQVIAEEWESASALLEETYGSPCERHSPRLAGDPHAAACHLYERSRPSDMASSD